MSATIYYALQLLAASLAVGLCLMAAYDGLRIFRVLVPHKGLWTGIEDTAYWLASSVATFLLLFRQNDGILRWYAIGGVLLGMLFYNMTASRILLKLLKKSEKYFTIKRTRRRLRKRQKQAGKQQKRAQKRLKQEEERKVGEQKRAQKRLKQEEERKAGEQKRAQKRLKQEEERKAGDQKRAQKRLKREEERKAGEQKRRERDENEIGETADAGKPKNAKTKKGKSE